MEKETPDEVDVCRSLNQKGIGKNSKEGKLSPKQGGGNSNFPIQKVVCRGKGQQKDHRKTHKEPGEPCGWSQIKNILLILMNILHALSSKES